MTTIKRGLLGLLVAFIAVLVVPTVIRWEEQRPLHQRVLEALRDDDLKRRYDALETLRDKHRTETTHILLRALDDTDSKVRHRSASFLSKLPKTPELRDALISHLADSNDSQVRLSCAIVLMTFEKKSAPVRDAYIQALKDSSEKVVQIACTELGYRGGALAKSALFQTLSHPSWHVRLEACKALITSKAADKRVVSTLKAMSLTPEATKYDAQIDDFARFDKEHGVKEKGWGKIATILQEAEQMAANKHPKKLTWQQTTTNQEC